MENKNTFRNSFLNKSRLEDEIYLEMDYAVLEEIEKLNLKIEELKNKIDNKIMKNLEKQHDKSVKQTNYKHAERVKDLIFFAELLK